MHADEERGSAGADDRGHVAHRGGALQLHDVIARLVLRCGLLRAFWQRRVPDDDDGAGTQRVDALEVAPEQRAVRERLEQRRSVHAQQFPVLERAPLAALAHLEEDDRGHHPCHGCSRRRSRPRCS